MKEDVVGIILYVISFFLIGFGLFIIFNYGLGGPENLIDQALNAGRLTGNRDNNTFNFLGLILSGTVGIKSLSSGLAFLFMARTVDLLFQIKNK